MYNIRVAHRANNGGKKINRFDTLASYNFRMNPNYKYLFIKTPE